MAEQTKAQRLAALIEPWGEEEAEAAAELRRLEQSEQEGWRYADELEQERKRLTALVAELVEALSLIQPIQCDNLHHEKKHRHSYAESCPVKEWIDGVIAKAKEQRRNTRWENTMPEQTKAQRLADRIHCGDDACKCTLNKTSAELRRLDALNAELVSALGFIVGAFRDTVNGKTSFYMPGALRKAEAALAKAKEQT